MSFSKNIWTEPNNPQNIKDNMEAPLQKLIRLVEEQEEQNNKFAEAILEELKNQNAQNNQGGSNF